MRDQWSEVYNQHLKPIQERAIKWFKLSWHVPLDRTGAPDTVWYFAVKCIADVHNMIYDSGLDMTLKQWRHGVLPSPPIFNMRFGIHEEVWPNTKERLSRGLGVAQNIGNFSPC